MAARSTTAGTPVKSWSSTRAVRKAISFSTFAAHVPARHRFDVGLLHEGAVLVPEQILEEDLEAEGEPVARCRPSSLRERVEAVDRVGLARDVEGRAAAERIE